MSHIINKIADILHSYAHEAIEQNENVNRGDPSVRELDLRCAEEIYNAVEEECFMLTRHDPEEIPSENGWYLCDSRCNLTLKTVLLFKDEWVAYGNPPSGWYSPLLVEFRLPSIAKTPGLMPSLPMSYRELE